MIGRNEENVIISSDKVKEVFVMKNKRMKWMHHIIAFVLVIAMLLPLATPVSAQAAENDLYLAYQNTEYGVAVVTLETTWEKEDYKVTELFLRKGDKVDLCFINASKWKEPKWTSSNSKVASVDSSGVITALSDGVAEITLTYTKKGFKEKKFQLQQWFMLEKVIGI